MSKRNRLYIFLLALAAAAVAALIICLNLMAPKYTIEALTGKTESEIDSWAESINLPSSRLLYTYIYSDTAEEGTAISQSVNAGGTLARNQVLTVTMSLGPNVDTSVSIPDFTGQTLSYIQAWAEENGLTNITYSRETNDDLEEGTFISISPAAGSSVQPGEAVTVTTSHTDLITVPSFSGMTRENIDSWCSENNVYARYYYEWSGTVYSGYFIRSDVSEGDKIRPESTVTFVLAS